MSRETEKAASGVEGAAVEIEREIAEMLRYLMVTCCCEFADWQRPLAATMGRIRGHLYGATPESEPLK